MNHHKRATPFHLTGDAQTAPHLLVRAIYGFSCYPGHASPHFFVTGEAWDARERAKQPGVWDRIGREPRSAGKMFADLRKIEPIRNFLGQAITFDAFDPDRGPIHYVENALYWLDLVEHPERKRLGEKPAGYFFNQICWEALAEDSDRDGTLRLLVEATPAQRRLWLNNRLPHLCLAFHEMLKNLNALDLLDAAWAEFRS